MCQPQTSHSENPHHDATFHQHAHAKSGASPSRDAPSNGANFALVCSKCLSAWYFPSQDEALSARSGHEDPTTLFRWEFLPTKQLPSGHMLREHVWLEILEIESDGDPTN